MAELPALTLGPATGAYIKIRTQQRAAATVVGERSTVTRMLRVVGDMPLRKLTPSVMETLFYGPRSPYTHLSPASWNAERARVSAFCTYLERRGWAKPGLMSLVEGRKEMDRDRFRLSPRQLLALPGQVDDPRDRCMVAVAIHTAIRRGNLLALRVGDLDLQAAQLRVVVTKSSKISRKPISTELDAELRIWLTHMTHTLGQPEADWYLFPGYTKGGWFQKALDPSKPCSTTAGEAIIRPLLHSLGGEHGDGWHTLRRSTARAYFDSLRGQGFDHALLATSVLLDHKDTATTLRYLGLSREREILDDTIMGKSWLTDMVPSEGVVPLRVVEG